MSWVFSEATYHRWRSQFGGLKAKDAKPKARVASATGNTTITTIAATPLSDTNPQPVNGVLSTLIGISPCAVDAWPVGARR